jgi:hypothetical protein
MRILMPLQFQRLQAYSDKNLATNINEESGGDEKNDDVPEEVMSAKKIHIKRNIRDNS